MFLLFELGILGRKTVADWGLSSVEFMHQLLAIYQNSGSDNFVMNSFSWRILTYGCGKCYRGFVPTFLAQI